MGVIKMMLQGKEKFMKMTNLDGEVLVEGNFYCCRLGSLDCILFFNIIYGCKPCFHIGYKEMVINDKVAEGVYLTESGHNFCVGSKVSYTCKSGT
jgi:hypothetical protein